MTGHGQALVQSEAARVLVEVKSVNNRFLKTHVYSELDANRQAQIESLIKQHVDRGSITLKVKCERFEAQDSYRINPAILRSYWLQLAEIAGNSQHVNIESLLQLPGVVHENLTEDDAEIWPLIEQAALDALQQLKQMREQEGAAMKQDMLQNIADIQSHLANIQNLAPQVAEAYEQRLLDRIRNLIEKHNLETQSIDVVREVGLYAERSDVSEEIVRLGSHLKQFQEQCSSRDGNGRTLDFLVQEMLRETNTIGSKASNSEIANCVVAIKTIIERIREMVQNVE